MVAAGAGFSIFEDVVIILLPVREIKQLNLGPRRRLAIILMFTLGSLYASPLNPLPFNQTLGFSSFVSGKY